MQISGCTAITLTAHSSTHVADACIRAFDIWFIGPGVVRSSIGDFLGGDAAVPFASLLLGGVCVMHMPWIRQEH